MIQALESYLKMMHTRCAHRFLATTERLGDQNFPRSVACHAVDFVENMPQVLAAGRQSGFL